MSDILLAPFSEDAARKANNFASHAAWFGIGVGSVIVYQWLRK